ncbi:DgyrCDS3335 [Dimorphilus gyrociliatus]|uniref:DgyrCDS3335 n=1 Tax=Dimorphilus gyrociliatus TaxID=2664684 RepID=A0A7I8VEP6_9ANNE|nr:DgyrCDS3335 [Dimorphilus gyrociliatus]
MNFDSILRSETNRTATYCGVCKSDGEVLNGIGDFDIHQIITPDYLQTFETELKEASLVFVDGNIPKESISYICNVCQKANTPVWFEPTDLNLAYKGLNCNFTYTSPNLDELRAMSPSPQPLGKLFKKDNVNLAASLGNNLLNSIPNILITLGKHGVLLCQRNEVSFNKRTFRYFPVKECTNVENVLGAGDCLAATFAYHHILQDMDVISSMQLGLLAAQISLTSIEAVSASIVNINLEKSKAILLEMETIAIE